MLYALVVFFGTGMAKMINTFNAYNFVTIPPPYVNRKFCAKNWTLGGEQGFGANSLFVFTALTTENVWKMAKSRYFRRNLTIPHISTPRGNIATSVHGLLGSSFARLLCDLGEQGKGMRFSVSKKIHKAHSSDLPEPFLHLIWPKSMKLLKE